MKKKRLAGLILLAPLALLCACGGSIQLSFSPNWYKDNTVSNITGTDETLEYEVSFRPNTENAFLSYDKGTYVVTMKDEQYTRADGSMELTYHLHAELHITGKYQSGTKSETFEDSMLSDVWFMPPANGLTPLESRTEVKATVPETALNAENLSKRYEFTTHTVYEADLSAATCTTDITLPEAEKGTTEKRVEIDDGTFLDNEEMIVGLRGLNASSAVSFNTLDPQTQRQVPVSVSPEAAKEAVNFDLVVNGETVKVEKTIEAMQMQVSYTDSEPGPLRYFVYAVRVQDNPETNEYRNVLLRFENPVMYSLGTMTYKLTKATFNSK